MYMSDIGGITAITLCDNQIDTYANCELEFKNKSKVYIPEEFVDYSLNYIKNYRLFFDLLHFHLLFCIYSFII